MLRYCFSFLCRYTEHANNVQLQETVSLVHFIMIDSTKLKLAIIQHCHVWQELLLKLLQKNTAEKINSCYQYTRENTEKYVDYLLYYFLYLGFCTNYLQDNNICYSNMQFILIQTFSLKHC